MVLHAINLKILEMLVYTCLTIVSFYDPSKFIAKFLDPFTNTQKF